MEKATRHNVEIAVAEAAGLIKPVPCVSCKYPLLPATPGSYIYTDADGARIYHEKCVPKDIIGRCYICKAPAQREHPFTVTFVAQGWTAERGVCARKECYEALAKEAKEAEGIDAGKWCLVCKEKYDMALAACPKCGKE